MVFLRDPGAIRKSIVEALEHSSSLDAAVAFVGRDWSDIIGTFPGQIRVICWLSSTNTNPYAVEQMMRRENISVRQLSAMHAKVYILKGDHPRCIVGSANLTGAALSEENASGQFEAAVEFSDSRNGPVVRWFRDLWNSKAQSISREDLTLAKEVWSKVQRGRHALCRRPPSRPVSFFPANWKPKKKLIDLAEKASDPDLPPFAEYRDVLSRIERHGRNVDVGQLIEYVAKWQGHPDTYQSALREPASRIREAFRTLFDRSRSVESRLRDLHSGGSRKIAGFALPSLTVILYWRFPSEYPPFNSRTRIFLEGFKLDELAPKSLTPRQYGKWIAFCQELSARLNLPSSGHIDRLVDTYYSEI